MRIPVRLPRPWLILAFALLTGVTGRAQSVFLAERGDKMCPVVSMRDSRPQVLADGKIVETSSNRFSFAKAEEYRPLLVTVRDFRINTSGRNVNGSPINNEVHLHAEFETPFHLDDVFFVVELHPDRPENLLFAHEVGTLVPREARQFDLTIPVSGRLGNGQYRLHVFAGGRELLHSKMPEEVRDRALDRMVAKRIASVHAADPQPFVGPAPDYPEKLLKEGRSGRVMISIRVDTAGRVHDLAVQSADDPAFGEAALSAVQLWRFLPRITDGKPVESKLLMPLDFTPPGQEKKT
ncbi:MAG TPA: energy transducer TonB [Candidatus Didemnitutus sp.]|nr:energy transducer TonB [Candidatus Didemnitutus sp.]